jgi:hypothetical protein
VKPSKLKAEDVYFSRKLTSACETKLKIAQYTSFPAQKTQKLKPACVRIQAYAAK